MASIENRAPWLTPARAGAVLVILAAVLFLFRLGAPPQLNFDESHYVPAARALLALESDTNREHPPLAKLAIAAGIAMFGDEPFGWRVMSAVAGVGLIFSVFALAYGLFRCVAAASMAAGLALVNQLVFIQARIAMMEVFWAAFVMTGLALLVHAAQPTRTRTGVIATLALCGGAFGLAAASKWAALPMIGIACLSFAGVRLYETLRDNKPLLTGVVWRADHALWPGVSSLFAAGIIIGCGLIAYVAAYVPHGFLEKNAVPLSDLIAHQSFMWRQQTQTLAPHPYQSDWWSWPLMTRPMWYFYEHVEGRPAGVLFVGNPVVLWGGLLAVLGCVYAGIKDRALRPAIAAGLYLGAFLPWIIIPKSLGFFYYYFLPALMLSLCVGALYKHYREHRWAIPIALGYCAAAALMFAFFYPIISAWPLADDGVFHIWAWFKTWY